MPKSGCSKPRRVFAIFFASRGLDLNDERDDGLPALGVVLELLAVVAVLAQGPDGHLESSGEAEQTG